jgi:type I restriction-modification system DNA methylase subunit
MPTDLKSTLQVALQAIPTGDFRAAHLGLLDALGYRSDKTRSLPGAAPEAFAEMIDSASGTTLNREKACFDQWTHADLLFQLTDEELSGQKSLFDATELKPKLLQSYLFFAIQLSGSHYSRTDLSTITRQINRCFPMPVMVLFSYNGELSVAVINRRQHKREAHKDVLGKVTLIHGIRLDAPHRGHLEILESFSVDALTTKKRPIDSFDALHAAWEEVFNVELLNKKFYRELSNWFFWAMRHSHFPLLDEKADKYFLFKDREKVREHEAKNLIRLLTRILFVWFIKQKDLVPDALFDVDAISEDFLEDFDPESKDTRYYKAILQNLFFACLNQTQGKREFRKSGQHHNTTTLLRYESAFKEPSTRFIETVESVTPFLNGGLFECLDYPHATKKGPQGGDVTIYEDGFSDRKDNPLVLPDFLFFGAPQHGIDLSPEYGDPKKKSESVRGLIDILKGYKFTIVENTPIEQEIALDPELLGQVFENLLASYNEETKTTARKQTGSFYTPRSIVDYMVDESLKAHLLQALAKNETTPGTPNSCLATADETKEKLDQLFTYTDEPHPFSPEQVDVLIRAIDNCKILDPACGSGAFPMGALQKLVYILGKLDPRDELWEKRQLTKVDKLIEAAQDFDDTTFRERAIADAEAQRTDIEEAFANNELGYGRKLYLIENCLYGVDIQSIATQVSKLRCFISLIVDQTVDRQRENFGIRPLPNLETKFVTADTLIQIEKPKAQGELFEITEVSELQKQLKRVRHDLFSAKTPKTKKKHRERDKELRVAIAEELKQNGWANDAADKLAAWDPYDQNASAPYFDPEWMFGLPGFDVVIGNPPYIQIQKFPKAQKDKWVAQDFQTYAATADIYCLFYERGAQLLKDGGSLVYITSNKWMRAGYGEKLRKYLSSEVDTESVLDFGMAQNFGAATTYTCITRFYRQKPDDRIRSCYVTDDRAAMANPEEYFEANAVVQKDLSALPWVILSPERHAIKKQVEAQGIPLGKWDIQIYRGVLTGFNDAFYLTQEQRDAFVAQDPNCAKYLVPLLRGRYVSRYATDWDGTWMINSHNGVKSKGVPPVDLKRECPVLWQHVAQYEAKLSKRQDKGDHWSNLRNCVYVEEFNKPKIIYPNMTKYLPFYYDSEDGFFTNDKGFILSSTGDSVAYLAAFLNSALFKYCFSDNFPELMGNTYEVRKIFVDIIPIKKPSTAEAELFEKLVPLVQAAKKSKLSTAATFLETLIDACVMECYFRDHMAERDLLFQDTVATQLAEFTPISDVSPEAIEGIVTRLQATELPAKLKALPEKSPDLLAVILKQGKV